jgi:hypothetical protein
VNLTLRQVGDSVLSPRLEVRLQTFAL